MIKARGDEVIIGANPNHIGVAVIGINYRVLISAITLVRYPYSGEGLRGKGITDHPVTNYNHYFFHLSEGNQLFNTFFMVMSLIFVADHCCAQGTRPLALAPGPVFSNSVYRAV